MLTIALRAISRGLWTFNNIMWGCNEKDEIVVRARPDRAFTSLANFNRNPEWIYLSGHILRVQQTSQDVLGTGATFTVLAHHRETGPYGATSEQDREYQLKVTEFVADKRLSWSMTGDGYARFTIRLSPTEDGTLVIYHREWIRPPGNWVQLPLMVLWNIFLWPYRLVLFLRGRSGIEDLMQRLKARVESEA